MTQHNMPVNVIVSNMCQVDINHRVVMSNVKVSDLRKTIHYLICSFDQYYPMFMYDLESMVLQLGGRDQIPWSFRSIEDRVYRRAANVELAHVSDGDAPPVGVQVLVYELSVLDEREIAPRAW